LQKYLKFLLVSILAFGSYTGISQENTRLLNGNVKSLKNDVADILIINLNTKQSTITDSLGRFTIEVKLRDSLRFTAVQYLTKEIVIIEALFLQNFLDVTLIENIINLDEVTVTPYNLSGQLNFDIDRLGLKPAVTSSTLGLPNAGVQKMTQSERLLLEADRGKYVRLATIEDRGKLMEILGYATVSVVINTHKIMNRVSGRTKSFEDMVARDENMELEKEIIAKFSKKTIAEDLDIPEENIDGFLTYCMAQKDFSEVSEAANTIAIWDYLKVKSIAFKNAAVIQEK